MPKHQQPGPSATVVKIWTESLLPILRCNRRKSSRKIVTHHPDSRTRLGLNSSTQIKTAPHPTVKRPKVNVSCRIHDKAFRNTLNQPSFQGNSLGVSERPYLVCTLRDGDLDKNFGICCGSCIRNWSNRGARRCLIRVKE